VSVIEAVFEFAVARRGAVIAGDGVPSSGTAAGT
jgi:hypothetical protein